MKVYPANWYPRPKPRPYYRKKIHRGLVGNRRVTKTVLKELKASPTEDMFR